MPDLILASASPRRRVLLHRLGLRFDVVVPDVDETPAPGESPAALVARLAVAKARAVGADLPHAVVLAADTVVVHGGAGLGKPEDRDHAVRMLRALSGARVEVISGVAVRSSNGTEVDVVTSTLVLRAFTEAQIAAYVATGEADDKAGALAVQGAAGGFVERIEGSRSNVIGLPLGTTRALLERAGVVLPPTGRPG